MAKKFTLIVFIAAVIVSLFFAVLDVVRYFEDGAKKHTHNAVLAERKIYRRPGEEISYDVKFGIFTVGSAIFKYVGRVAKENQELDLISFETRLAHFKDKEDIYTDPLTDLPVIVERDIEMWPLREKITESYNQQDYTITIKKEGSKQVSIKKSTPIHSAVLLPYYLRNLPELSVGMIVTAECPSETFIMKLAGIEDVEVPAGSFKAYRFEGSGLGFQIWVSKDDMRLPVKIKNTGKLGYTFLMRKHN